MPHQYCCSEVALMSPRSTYPKCCCLKYPLRCRLRCHLDASSMPPPMLLLLCRFVTSTVALLGLSSMDVALIALNMSTSPLMSLSLLRSRPISVSLPPSHMLLCRDASLNIGFQPPSLTFFKLAWIHHSPNLY